MSANYGPGFGRPAQAAPRPELSYRRTLTAQMVDQGYVSFDCAQNQSARALVSKLVGRPHEQDGGVHEVRVFDEEGGPWDFQLRGSAGKTRAVSWKLRGLEQWMNAFGVEPNTVVGLQLDTQGRVSIHVIKRQDGLQPQQSGHMYSQDRQTASESQRKQQPTQQGKAPSTGAVRPPPLNVLQRAASGTAGASKQVIPHRRSDAPGATSPRGQPPTTTTQHPGRPPVHPDLARAGSTSLPRPAGSPRGTGTRTQPQHKPPVVIQLNDRPSVRLRKAEATAIFGPLLSQLQPNMDMPVKLRDANDSATVYAAALRLYEYEGSPAGRGGSRYVLKALQPWVRRHAAQRGDAMVLCALPDGSVTVEYRMQAPAGAGGSPADIRDVGRDEESDSDEFEPDPDGEMGEQEPLQGLELQGSVGTCATASLGEEGYSGEASDSAGRALEGRASSTVLVGQQQQQPGRKRAAALAAAVAAAQAPIAGDLQAAAADAEGPTAATTAAGAEARPTKRARQIGTGWSGHAAAAAARGFDPLCGKVLAAGELSDEGSGRLSPTMHMVSPGGVFHELGQSREKGELTMVVAGEGGGQFKIGFSCGASGPRLFRLRPVMQALRAAVGDVILFRALQNSSEGGGPGKTFAVSLLPRAQLPIVPRERQQQPAVEARAQEPFLMQPGIERAEWSDQPLGAGAAGTEAPRVRSTASAGTVAAAAAAPVLPLAHSGSLTCLTGSGSQPVQLLPAPSLTPLHLHGCVPPEVRLPPLRPGELRLCGLTFHPDLAPGVRAAMGAWLGAQEDVLAELSPSDKQVQFPGPETPGLRPNIIAARLVRYLGINPERGWDAPLPAELREPAVPLERCEDGGRGGAGLRLPACGQAVKKDWVLGVVGGYVLPTRDAVKLAARGMRNCSDEVRAAVERRVNKPEERDTAWAFLARSFMMPLLAEGSPAQPLTLSMLGYGNPLALVNDPRVEPRAWVAGNDVEDEAVAAAAVANCMVLPVCVRGVVLPVLVATRDIAPGEQLLRDYGSEWWRSFAEAVWELAEDDGLTPQQLLSGAPSGPDPAESGSEPALPAPPLAPPQHEAVHAPVPAPPAAAAAPAPVSRPEPAPAAPPQRPQEQNRLRQQRLAAGPGADVLATRKDAGRSAAPAVPSAPEAVHKPPPVVVKSEADAGAEVELGPLSSLRSARSSGGLGALAHPPAAPQPPQPPQPPQLPRKQAAPAAGGIPSAQLPPKAPAAVRPRTSGPPPLQTDSGSGKAAAAAGGPPSPKGRPPRPALAEPPAPVPAAPAAEAAGLRRAGSSPAQAAPSAAAGQVEQPPPAAEQPAACEAKPAPGGVWPGSADAAVQPSVKQEAGVAGGQGEPCGAAQGSTAAAPAVAAAALGHAGGPKEEEKPAPQAGRAGWQRVGVTARLPAARQPSGAGAAAGAAAGAVGAACWSSDGHGGGPAYAPAEALQATGAAGGTTGMCGVAAAGAPGAPASVAAEAAAATLLPARRDQPTTAAERMDMCADGSDGPGQGQGQGQGFPGVQGDAACALRPGDAGATPPPAKPAPPGPQLLRSWRDLVSYTDGDEEQEEEEEEERWGGGLGGFCGWAGSCEASGARTHPRVITSWRDLV